MAVMIAASGRRVVADSSRRRAGALGRYVAVARAARLRLPASAGGL
jgi:hypothetical protein